MIRAVGAAILGALACSAIVGCASIEATRFYRSGTDALDRGESQRAIADLEHAAELAPDISAIQNHLGIAYEEAGRTDDAQRAYERAVALDCDNRAAENNLRELRETHDLRPAPKRAGARSESVSASAARRRAARCRVHDFRSAPDGAEPNTGQDAWKMSGRDGRRSRGPAEALLERPRQAARQAAQPHERASAARGGGGGARGLGDAVVPEETRSAALREGRQERDPEQPARRCRAGCARDAGSR